MTLTELETMVAVWLDDVNETYFTQSQIWRWLNNAQREAQKQLIQAGENFYVTRASTSLVVDQDTYALPDDFMRLNQLEIAISGSGTSEVRQSLGFVTLNQLNSVSMTSGTPTNYTLRGNCIVVRPIPDAALTMYMDYSYLVTDMSTGGSTPNVPAQYHEYLAVLATIDGFLRDRRDPSPMLAKKEFFQSLMKQDAENRNVDSPRTVVVTDDYGVGSLF